MAASQPRTAEPTTIDVCIATYRRPDALRRLLESLSAQTLPEGVVPRVVVVDNDAAGSARPVVERFAGAFPLAYEIQPLKNISLTRNRCMALARSELVVLIDDDAYPASDWLARLIACQRRYHADVVLGPSWPVFPPDTPKALVASGALRIPVLAEGSTRGFYKDTCNCLLRRDAWRGLDGPFDPTLGLSGGEDLDFFTRLERSGKRLVWCPDAHVFSPLHSGRNTVRYALKRKFFRGELNAKIRWRHAHASALMTTLLAHVKLAGGLVLVAAAAALAWRAPDRLVKYACKCAYQAGYIKYAYSRRVHEEYA